MKIYVDEKPEVCKKCLFRKCKNGAGYVVNKPNGMNNMDDSIVGYVDITSHMECFLLGIKVDNDIANITTLGNCPLEVIKLENK